MVDCCEIYHQEPPKQQKEIKEKPREEKRPRESPKVDQRHDCKSDAISAKITVVE